MLDHTNYIVGTGADTRVAMGAFLEILLIIANVGSAVVLFPVLKRQNEGLALGYVTARIVESTFVGLGTGILLAIVTLRQDVGSAGGATHLSRSAGHSSRSTTGRSCSGRAGSSASGTD